MDVHCAPGVPARVDGGELRQAVRVGHLVAAEEILPRGAAHLRIDAARVAMPDVHLGALQRSADAGSVGRYRELQGERQTRARVRARLAVRVRADVRAVEPLVDPVRALGEVGIEDAGAPGARVARPGVARPRARRIGASAAEQHRGSESGPQCFEQFPPRLRRSLAHGFSLQRWRPRRPGKSRRLRREQCTHRPLPCRSRRRFRRPRAPRRRSASCPRWRAGNSPCPYRARPCSCTHPRPLSLRTPARRRPMRFQARNPLPSPPRCRRPPPTPKPRSRCQRRSARCSRRIPIERPRRRSFPTVSFRLPCFLGRRMPARIAGPGGVPRA